MRVHRILLDKDDIVLEENEVGTCVYLALNNSSEHHLLKVLRLKVGDIVEAIDRCSANAYRICVEKIEKDSMPITNSDTTCPKEVILNRGRYIQGELKELRSSAEQTQVSVLVGFSKNAQMDLIVEKGVELGVRQFLFFVSDRSQGLRTSEERKKREKRLKRVSEAAIKQSGALAEPQIEIFPSLLEALQYSSQQPLFSKTEGESRIGQTKFVLTSSLETIENPALFRDLKACTDNLQKKPVTGLIELLERQAKSAESLIVVGPAGGLSEEEISATFRFGFQPASLGSRTLKTETAVIVAVGLLKAFNNREYS